MSSTGNVEDGTSSSTSDYSSTSDGSKSSSLHVLCSLKITPFIQIDDVAVVIATHRTKQHSIAHARTHARTHARNIVPALAGFKQPWLTALMKMGLPEATAVYFLRKVKNNDALNQMLSEKWKATPHKLQRFWKVSYPSTYSPC